MNREGRFLLTYRGSPYEVTNIGSIRPSRKLASGISWGTVSPYICEQVPPAPKRPTRQNRWLYIKLFVIFDLVQGGRVAQLVEQCPFKAWVEGSNPSALTRFKHYSQLGSV